MWFAMGHGVIESIVVVSLLRGCRDVRLSKLKYPAWGRFLVRVVAARVLARLSVYIIGVICGL